MRVLWIATKPPAPATDGGRLVTQSTIEALEAAGATVTLVAPRTGAAPEPGSERIILVESPRPGWPGAGWKSLWSGRPLTITRHGSPAMTACVADLVRRETFDVVHIEQLQALDAAAPARARGLACVLRAQNVESLVWQHAITGRGLRARLMRAESRRLRRFETAALAMVDATITLSLPDAAYLSTLDPSARVVAIPPPAPRVAPGPRAVLPGEPAFTWIGSGGWPPNEDAIAWLMRAVWPALSQRLPAARLHAFGVRPGRAPGVVYHEAPRESRSAFADGSILLLPLRLAAGVRMRLLEAWALGVPVIASPAAVHGLETADGVDVLLAGTPEAFAEAGARLVHDAGLRARLVEGGRATLARRHAPAAVAGFTLEVYRDAMDSALCGNRAGTQ